MRLSRFNRDLLQGHKIVLIDIVKRLYGDLFLRFTQKELDAKAVKAAKKSKKKPKCCPVLCNEVSGLSQPLNGVCDK